MAAEGNINLSREKLEDSLGVMLRLGNAQVIETFDRVAQIVTQTGDDNNLNEQVLDACRTIQNSSNTFFESLRNTAKDVSELAGISDYLAAVDLGSVQNRDLSYQNAGYDSSDIQ